MPPQVPPKLCVSLMSDKAMRDTCKKFGLPSAGRKEVCVVPPRSRIECNHSVALSLAHKTSAFLC